MDQNTPGLKHKVYSILLETFKEISYTKKANLKTARKWMFQLSALCLNLKEKSKYGAGHESFSNHSLTSKSRPFTVRYGCGKCDIILISETISMTSSEIMPQYC